MPTTEQTVSPGSVEVGVDIGGTFTDVVCLTPDSQVRLVKIPTTKGDPSIAVLKAVRHMQEAWGIAPADIVRFAHGTTIATNAVLERKVAKIGLITTEGFRDVLEVGRQFRNAMYDVILQPETPGFLAPGALRKEVPERISGTGAVVTPLDEAALGRAVEALVAENVEGIAVCFLFSFLNPMHERRARELILKQHPDIRISLSSEVDPAFREYERTVATVFDVSIKPVVDRYLTKLESGLAAAGVVAPLQVIQSRGGLAAAAIARERPVRLFLSGPAAGVIGGCMVGRGAGIKDLITLDVGGTSSDIALIRNGRPTVRAEGKIAGYPVRVPMAGNSKMKGSQSKRDSLIYIDSYLNAAVLSFEPE